MEPLFVCQICHQDYNLIDRSPRILRQCCRKTLCSICLDKAYHNYTFKCPFDTEQFTSTEDEIELFPFHSEIMDALDKKRANEKNETLIKNKKIPEEIKRELQNLQEGLKGLDSQSEKLENVFKEKTNSFQDVVKKKFKQIQRKLNNEQLQTSDKIKSFFQNEGTKVKNTLGIDSPLRKEMVKLIQALSAARDRSILAELSDEITKVKSKLEFLISNDHVGSYEAVLENSSLEFEARLDTVLNSFPKINEEFKNGEISERLYNIYILDYNSDIWESRRQDFSQVKAIMNFKVKNGLLTISNNNKMSKVKIEEGTEENFNEEGLKKATKVHLKISEVDHKNMEVTRWVWSKLEQLSSLKLDFVSKAITDEQIKILPWDVFKKKKLQEIDIQFKGCSRVGDETFKNFINNVLNNVIGLTSVSLNASTTRLKNESLETFAKTLQPIIGNLQELKLCLMKVDISDHSIANLFSNMQNMKKFCLNLYCTKVTDSSIEKFSRNSLKTMNLLEEFELDLGCTTVTDRSISSMFIAMPDVKSFILRLGKCKINEKSLVACFDKTLSTFKELKVFEMDLRETGVTDKSVGMIWPVLKNLNSFKLNLGDIPQLTDASIQGLVDCREKLMRVLETFELNLEGTSITSDKISQIFSKMPKAKRFSINLAKDTKIGDQVLINFVNNSLLSMRSLVFLSINLSETKISDEGITSLAVNFRSISKLQEFQLNLQKTKVSDKSMEKLFEKVGELEKLSKVSIDCSNTQVSNDLIQKIAAYQHKLLQKK